LRTKLGSGFPQRERTLFRVFTNNVQGVIIKVQRSAHDDNMMRSESV
jgi:hypothetical protein